MLHEASFIADGLGMNIYVLRTNITFSNLEGLNYV